MTMELAKNRPSPADLGVFYEAVRGLLGAGNLWMCLDEAIESVRLFWRTPGGSRGVSYAIRCKPQIVDVADMVAMMIREKLASAPDDDAPVRRGTTKLVHAVANYRRSLSTMRNAEVAVGQGPTPDLLEDLKRSVVTMEAAELTMFAALDEVASDN